MRALALRALRYLSLTALALILALFAFIQIQQAIFHHHVVRLLADAQSIELHKSTWSDAQTLMHRWGRWGHYAGTCSSTACKYEIGVDDALDSIWGSAPEWFRSGARFLQLDHLCFFLGARLGNTGLSFIVQDGRIVRKGVSALAVVGPYAAAPDDQYGYAIIVNSIAVDRVLTWAEYDHWDQFFAREPYYSGRRPGGCTSCFAATLRFHHKTPQALVTRLSAFNASCFSAFARCTTVEDLLPATEPFHFYTRPEPGPSQAYHPAERSDKPCAIPTWARARDASQIVVVDAIRDHTLVRGPELADPRIDDVVQPLTLLKGEGSFPKGPLLVHPYDPEAFDGHDPTEAMFPGKRYIMFGFDNEFMPKDSWFQNIQLTRCGVLAATPENLREVQEGLALNDHLREAELYRFP